MITRSTHTRTSEGIFFLETLHSELSKEDHYLMTDIEEMFPTGWHWVLLTSTVTIM